MGLKDSELQITAPARAGFHALSCVHAYSRVPARFYLLTCMHISPWLYSFTCTLSICFSVLPVATVISLSLSVSLFLSPFVHWAALLPLTSRCPSIPFDNNNIRTYIQGPKVSALCRCIRKDPSKPVCWREKILSLTIARTGRGKGPDYEI